MTAGAPMRVVVVGRDAALWLSVTVLHDALSSTGVTVTAVELPSCLGPADVYATLPPLEALHNQLRIDEAALMRATEGCFTLGQNFVDRSGVTAPFLHAYGAYGTAIEGRDFFAYWAKARGLGLQVALEDFSPTAAAARHGRLLIPDDESERFGRSDYGYHLPAQAYAQSLKQLALRDGIVVHAAPHVDVVRDANGAIAGVRFDGQTITGDLFIDASGTDASLIGSALGVERQSWRGSFPVDRVLVAAAAPLAPVPAYAELRLSDRGWTGLYPGVGATHVIHAFAHAGGDERQALKDATAASGLSLVDASVQTVDPGCRARAWAANCVAIGAAACVFDPVHNVDLHAVQLGLVRLHALFPASGNAAPERAEYNRLMQSSFDRLRDFQAAFYLLNRRAGAFWQAARAGTPSPELAHMIALFAARGEIAPYEDESFAPDSWRALFVGLGLMPATYSPTIDTLAPDVLKTQFRTMLGFVREQVLRQPTHDAHLQQIARHGRG